MEMTDGEIVNVYKHAKNKRSQIGILAQINDCSKAEIETIILAAGVELPAKTVKKATIAVEEVAVNENPFEDMPDSVFNALEQKKAEIDAIIENCQQTINEKLKEYEEICGFLKRFSA